MDAMQGRAMDGDRRAADRPRAGLCDAQRYSELVEADCVNATQRDDNMNSETKSLSKVKRQRSAPKAARRDWSKPREVDDAMLAFSASPIDEFLPGWSELPEDFRRHWHSGNAWTEAISKWFFNGLPGDTQIQPKPGIDARTALRHIAATLKSWAPKHEDKIAGCGYLLSLWFDQFGDARAEGRRQHAGSSTDAGMDAESADALNR